MWSPRRLIGRISRDPPSLPSVRRRPWRWTRARRERRAAGGGCRRRGRLGAGAGTPTPPRGRRGRCRRRARGRRGVCRRSAVDAPAARGGRPRSRRPASWGGCSARARVGVRKKLGEESPRNYLNRLTPERPKQRRTRAPSRRPHRPARVRTKVTDRKPCLTPPPPSTPPRCEPGPKQPIRASPTGRSRAHDITLLPRSVPLLPNCMRHRPEH